MDTRPFRLPLFTVFKYCGLPAVKFQLWNYLDRPCSGYLSNQKGGGLKNKGMLMFMDCRIPRRMLDVEC